MTLDEKKRTDLILKLADVSSYLFWFGIAGLLLICLAGAAFCSEEDITVGNFGMSILGSVIASVIVGIGTAVFSYKVFFKNMMDKNAARLGDKLEKKSDNILNDLKPNNYLLHEEHNELKNDNRELRTQLQAGCKELKTVLDAINTRGMIDESRYKLLDTNQRAVVDSIRRLDGMADMLQNVVSENSRLTEENRILKTQLQQYKVPTDFPFPHGLNSEPDLEL